jgi:hypothetical protein
MEKDERAKKVDKLHETRELANQISSEHEPRKLMIKVLRELAQQMSSKLKLVGSITM